MGPCGGEIAAMRPNPPSSDADAGEDRLSALPDDILVLILLRLGTSAAGQTSVLSRRWRVVWALLPELIFPHAREPNRIRDALEAHQAALRRLSVEIQSASPDSVAAWLLVAARRLAGRLKFRNLVPQGNDAVEDEDTDEVEVKEDEEGCEQRGSFELPCFESATAVSLDLGFLGLSVPAAGVCSRLTKLSLSRARFDGPCELGDAISSPRCPFLTKLSVRDSEGLTILTINSRSLLRVNLRGLRGLRRLAIEAPVLARLTVSHSFFFGHDQPVASISAPQLEWLLWLDSYEPSSMHLDKMERIERLAPFLFFVYGGQRSISNNQSCLRLLQHFKVIETLILSLIYLEGLDNCSYLMDDMTVLPGITNLHLRVIANGHAFGASTFHVLRMCSGIRLLNLKLEMEAQTACSFGCICGQHAHWKTEELVLYCLQEVEITGLMGSECEISFVKQLLNWATVLKKLTVIFEHSVAENEAKEFCQMLRSFSRLEICTEFHGCKGTS
ncbi:hypothetical protein EJB05_14975, partial [Eragrostis curvula]